MDSQPKTGYSQRLQDPRWQKKRLEVLERDNFTCQLCGDTKTILHIHHFVYNTNYNPWDVADDSLITYCKHCHAVIEYYNNTTHNPYKIIKSNSKKTVCVAVFNLCEHGVFDFFLYKEDTGSLINIAVVPSDFINRIDNNFITVNSLYNG